MPVDEPMLGQQAIAEYLGVGRQAVKKWRGNTRAALRRAGQLDSIKPTARLPRNALPVPDNQREHIEKGHAPLWSRAAVDKWVDQTQRRDEATGGFKPALPSGRPADPNRRTRVRRPRQLAVVGDPRSQCSRHGPFDGAQCPGCPATASLAS